jgi:hypothetical protein
MAKRMEKRVKIFALLLVATVVYVAISSYDYMRYEQSCQQKLLSYPPEVRPYVDFYPYWMTASFKYLTASFAIGMLALFAIFLFVELKCRKLEAITCCLLLFLAVGIPIHIAIPSRVSAENPTMQTTSTEIIYINTFLVWDEEVAFSDCSRDEIAFYAIDWIRYYYENYFYEKYGLRIVFCCSNWNLWFSDNTESDPLELLKDAINETQWSAGSHDGAHIMIVATGQQMDIYGFSPPDYKALIFYVPSCYEEEALKKAYSILMHEIGHQFKLEHCDDIDCAMFGSLTPILPITYCDECKEQIYTNRYALIQKTDPNPNSYKNNGGCATKARPC